MLPPLKTVSWVLRTQTWNAIGKNTSVWKPIQDFSARDPKRIATLQLLAEETEKWLQELSPDTHFLLETSLQNVDFCQKESFWLVLGINSLLSLPGLHHAGFDVAAFLCQRPLALKALFGPPLFLSLPSSPVVQKMRPHFETNCVRRR